MKTLILAIFLSQSIPTSNADLNRTNSNSSESQLTPTSVQATQFGLRGSYTVDGTVFAQPLYIPSITISGKVHDLVIVATMNNSVYAFDGNTVNSSPLWSNLQFATPYTGFPQQEGGFYGAGLGCLSTPVVDVANLKLYVVCDSVSGSTPNWILRQLSLTTGATLQTQTISGQVVGTGDTGVSGCDGFGPTASDTTSGANLLFFPEYEFQRAGLALSADTSTVYIGFGGFNDTRPYHGWLMAYATSNLSQTAIWNSTPNSWGGAIWMSGGAPAIDASGNVYVTTGNGCRVNDAGAISNAVVKLSSNLGTVTTFFPSDEATDDTDDADQAANRFLLISGSGLGVAAGKDFQVYVLTLSTMALAQTQFHTSTGMPGGSSGSYGMAYLNNTLYLPITAGGIYAFSYSSGSFNTTPVTQSNSYGFPGPAQIFGSINGSSNGILWAVTCASGTHTTKQAGILRAINPSSMAEYWNSSTTGRDTLGNITKFTAPVIANGKVFVPTQDNKVQVFGINFASRLGGNAAIRGKINQ